jgi:hypothetical protein
MFHESIKSDIFGVNLRLLALMPVQTIKCSYSLEFIGFITQNFKFTCIFVCLTSLVSTSTSYLCDREVLTTLCSISSAENCRAESRQFDARAYLHGVNILTAA